MGSTTLWDLRCGRGGAEGKLRFLPNSQRLRRLLQRDLQGVHEHVIHVRDTAETNSRTRSIPQERVFDLPLPQVVEQQICRRIEKQSADLPVLPAFDEDDET